MQPGTTVDETASRRAMASAFVPTPRARWIGAAAAAAFILHALNYLYFFVDDEGIPFVYAQNVLRGRGLVYNAFEGRIEGYSDFLHVWIDTLILWTVQHLHWPKYSVFFVGQAISIAAGAGTVVLLFQILRHMRIVRAPGAAAALACLVLAGPLALWSCSSLETATFAFLLTLFLWALVRGGEEIGGRFDLIAVGTAGLGALERIDGFVYLGAVGLAFLVTATPARRRQILLRIALPAAGVLIAYHAWRVWYFGDLLPVPLRAKVLYKVRPAVRTVLTKAPGTRYWVAFAHVYGWIPVGLAAAGALVAARRDRTAAAVLLALTMCVVYVAQVGDWMFGFRFFVALLPMMALLVGCAVSVVAARRAGAAWTLAFVVAAWCAVSAVRFERVYEATERAPGWLRHPSFDHDKYFGTYDSLADAAARYIAPGARVAYNQAGFVPFMLDLENVDDLGICSRFYAELPVADVFFTEVGRYAPLTGKRSIRAAEAYLLYRDVAFIIQRSDLLRAANQGREPRQLMGGYYEWVANTSRGGDAIYRRTTRPAGEYRTDPRTFFENLAHVSYLDEATIDGRRLAPAEIGPQLPFLRDIEGQIEVAGQWQLDATFSPTDQNVYEIDVNGVRANAPAALTIDLVSASGAVVHRERLEVAPDRPSELFDRLPYAAGAARLRIAITGPEDRPIHVWLDDVRVQGQTPELARFIRTHLKFPAS